MVRRVSPGFAGPRRLSAGADSQGALEWLRSAGCDFANRRFFARSRKTRKENRNGSILIPIFASALRSGAGNDSRTFCGDALSRYGDPVCRNGFVEEGEDCDCGAEDCASVGDLCCNGATCKPADPAVFQYLRDFSHFVHLYFSNFSHFAHLYFSNFSHFAHLYFSRCAMRERARA